jgi:hypothetical protein
LILSVLTVDEQLRVLIPADLPCGIHGFDLGPEMPADSIGTTPSNIPSAVGVRNDVM